MRSPCRRKKRNIAYRFFIGGYGFVRASAMFSWGNQPHDIVEQRIRRYRDADRCRRTLRADAVATGFIPI